MHAAVVLDVDLDAVAMNWRLLCERHPRGAVAAVVKADGYGLGAVPVAKRLLREGCRHFFVAHLAEALVIRPEVPGAMVAALNGLWPGDAPEYVEHSVLPVLGSLGEVEAWSGQARRLGRSLPALLHVDTGMNRLGLTPAEVSRLAAEPGRLAGVELRYIMTHLTSAEVAIDPANGEQLRRFGAACAFLPAVPRSVANSSGVFLGTEFASDLARPGAALYGLNPVPSRANPMRGCVRLRARVLQVRNAAPGERVGYSGTWTACRPTRIATVSVGYADGFLRALSNRGGARFDGIPVPLVGRVSMDLTTFDVTDAPGAMPGAWLDLIGPDLPPDAVAERAGTNGYEVLTALGRRYQRAYLGV
jgi:alanine racemase